MDPFSQLSMALTGYSESELQGTGMLEPYRSALLRIIGEREAGRLLAVVTDVADDDARFRRYVWDDERFGPVARSVLSMWYLGTWTQLPREWRAAFGATAFDTDHVVSAASYRAGLVWPAGGTHPMSAKQPGFGSWALPVALGTSA